MALAMDRTSRAHDDVLRATQAIVGAHAIPYAYIGSIAASTYGACEWPADGEDIDLFLRAADAPSLLDAFGQNGFETERTFPDWLYKAKRDGVVVDLIFAVKTQVTLDDEMMARVRTATVDGLTLPVLAPEDLILTEIAAHGPETNSLLFNALEIIRRNEIDWKYLERRSVRHRPRVLSLLAYARSVGIDVDEPTAARLSADVFGSA